MSPVNKKFNSWASGDEPDARDQERNKRINQWAEGETGASKSLSAELIDRFYAWASGEEAAESKPAPEAKPKPAAAASKPKPAAEPAPKPSGVSSKPAASAPKPAAAPKPAVAPAAAKPLSGSAGAQAGAVGAREEEIAAKVSEQLAELQHDLALNDLNSQIQEARKNLSAASASLRDCRTRGYIFQKKLENTAADLEKQADSLRARIDEQIKTLKGEADKIETLLAKGASGAAPAQGAIGVLQNKIQAASTALEGECEGLSQAVEQFSADVQKIAWAVNQLEQAPFTLTASESLVDATQAVWKRAGSSMDVKGVLYLTDLRLLFERKDEIVTKKILFVATETKKMQNLEWEGAVQLIDKASSSQQGLLAKQELLTVYFAPQGPVDQVLLQIEGKDGAGVSSDEWSSLIGRVKNGSIEQDRTVPLDPKISAQKLPSHCPSCGAVFDQPVLRGQKDVNCQYCGQKISLQ